MCLFPNHFISTLEKSQNKPDAYCRMWWRKLSGVSSSRRKSARTSRLWIGRYLDTALTLKYSWNDLLCFRHHMPYGRRAMLKSHSILKRAFFFHKSEVKEIRYIQFNNHRQSHSVWVIWRPFVEQVSGPFLGAQNQKVLAKDIEIYHIT